MVDSNNVISSKYFSPKDLKLNFINFFLGDISNTEIVQDYRKKSLKETQPNSKNKRKILSQPSKPRVLICKREIGIEEENEFEPDWNLIAADQVGEHSYLGLVTIGGRLTTISLMLR